LLVQQLAQLSSAAEFETPNDVEFDARFLPLPSHVRALGKEIAVVWGGAGAGKTAFFQALGAKHPQAFFSQQQAEAATHRWVDGFSTGQRHPEVVSLDDFATHVDDSALRYFWLLHLAHCVAEAFHRPELLAEEGVPQDLHTRAFETPSSEEMSTGTYASMRVLKRIDDEQSQSVFVGYDALDLVGQWSPETRIRISATLVSLWLSFGARFSKLRPKIFLRKDLFESAVRRVVDGAKLRSRSVTLDWTVEDLFRVLVRHMAAQPALREWLHEVMPGLVVHEAGRGWMPQAMPEEVQDRFASALAGPFMGKDVKKGFTYRWIANHLKDGGGQVVPRSMIRLIGGAAEIAAQRNFDEETGPLLASTDLVNALPAMSNARVDELSHEFPIVRRLEHFRGSVLPLGEEQTAALLSKPFNAEDRDPTDGGAVLKRLEEVGVLVRRGNREGAVSIDMPDLYRYGYGIKRKGGAAG
jgi:hypothetical protein